MTMSGITVTSPQRTGVSLRKTNKPLMEKRRRARINDSLSQLKSLVIQSSKKDSSQFNKLEKADILELTVKHLRNLQDQHQQQQLSQASSDVSLVGKYQAGFMECANEVIRYLGQSQGFNDDVKSRVVHHLASCIQLSSKVSFTKTMQPGNTVVTSSSVMPAGLRATNGQLTNGQVIQIVNSQFQNTKPSDVGSFSGIQPALVAPVTSASSAPTHIPVAITAVTASTTPSSEPPGCIRYTQPLQIQIPSVLPTVLIQTKAAQHQNPAHQHLVHKVLDIVPQVIPRLINQQETLVPSNSPLPQPNERCISQSNERSMSPLPLRTCQKPQKHYTYDSQYSDYIPRTRTYSLTSSSSESDLSSPLNLSQSPQYYGLREVNNNKYPSPAGSQGTQAFSQSDTISSTHPVTRDGLFLSHCPSSNFTSVIVDARRPADEQALRYMHFIDEERHFIRHEGSTSPASSMGEERLWRPW